MALPTGQIGMSNIRTVLNTSGMPTTQLSMKDYRVRMICNQTTGQVNLGRAKGSSFVNITKWVQIDAGPSIVIRGWDRANGPMQGNGATAQGDFPVRGNNSIVGLFWRGYSSTNEYDITIQFNVPVVAGLQLILPNGLGTYNLPGGTQNITIPFSQSAFDSMSSSTTVQFVVYDTTV